MLTSTEVEALVEVAQRGLDEVSIDDEKQYHEYFTAMSKLLAIGQEDTLLKAVMDKQKEISDLRTRVDDEKLVRLSGVLQAGGEEILLEDYEADLDRMLTLGPGLFDKDDKHESSGSEKEMDDLLEVCQRVLKRSTTEGTLKPAVYRKTNGKIVYSPHVQHLKPLPKRK